MCDGGGGVSEEVNGVGKEVGGVGREMIKKGLSRERGVWDLG